VITNGLKPSNIKEWLWSAKVLTTIVWILFPLGYIITLTVPLYINIPFEEYVRIFRPYVIYYFVVQYPIIIPPIPLLMVLFIFAIFPAAYPSEKFFKKRGEANAVFEYVYIGKILYISTVLIIITIILLVYLYPQNQERLSYYSDDTFYLVLYEMLSVLAALPISILLKLLLERARKRFRFYYAKVCFELINKSESETDKAGFLSWGLEWYNKVVKRATKLYAMNMEAVYSMIMSHSPLNNNQILNSVLSSFHNGDEFKPLRYMLTLLSDGKQENVLVKETLTSKIKESSGLLIPIITVIITIISTFFLKPK
jgi:hypothetical protein